MSAALPKTAAYKYMVYRAQNGGTPLTQRQKRQLRRTDAHTSAQEKKRVAREANEKKRRRSEAAKKGAETRRQKKLQAELEAAVTSGGVE